MEQQTNTLALVTEEDLSLVADNKLNKQQLQKILQKTPAKYVKERPAKGGGKWNYVTGGYIRKVLNLMFGWDWDFEIIDERIEGDEVIVKGKLTCRVQGQSIVKMQYGNKDIAYRKAREGEDKKPLSLGNDMKAAATDCLKKCAAEIGIAADIYNAEDFNPVRIMEDEELTPESLEILYTSVQNQLTKEEQAHIDRVLAKKETASYPKVFKLLNSKL